jgi:hypothetical protein
MAEATTTPTPFSWASGPDTVQVTGSWDNWTERVALDKQADGTFSKKIPLPSNTKVHYKFIVDGNWTTSPNEPTANDEGNTNNLVDVGPAPTPTEAATAKAGEIGAAVAASVAGAAAATTAAAYKFADNVNGTTTDDKEEAAPETAKKTLSEEEKKAEPAAAIRETADEDIRSETIHLVQKVYILSLTMPPSARPRPYFDHNCFTCCSSRPCKCSGYGDGCRHSSRQPRGSPRHREGDQGDAGTGNER